MSPVSRLNPVSDVSQIIQLFVMSDTQIDIPDGFQVSVQINFKKLRFIPVKDSGMVF